MANFCDWYCYVYYSNASDLFGCKNCGHYSQYIYPMGEKANNILYCESFKCCTKDFSNYYLSKNKSIIFDIFFGCTTIITCCMYCHSQTYNVQVNNILFFPLEEVRKFKKKNKETPVTIYDCFDYNQRYDIYESLS